MTKLLRSLALALSLPAALAPIAALAADPPSSPSSGTPAVVDPKVERRDVRLPHIPSKDIEVGLYAGVYSTQNFGSSPVVGLRVGYHVTEDWFVQGNYGSTHASDATYRQVLPGGIFPQERTSLTYYNLSAGYNVLPGEVFAGSKNARASALYLLAGVGSTKLDRQRYQTINLGVGTRVLVAERLGVQVEMRDHMFRLDILGKPERTHNLELTLGGSYFF